MTNPRDRGRARHARRALPALALLGCLLVAGCGATRAEPPLAKAIQDEQEQIESFTPSPYDDGLRESFAHDLRALVQRAEREAPDSVLLAQAYLLAGRIEQDQQRPDRAIDLLQRSLAIRRHHAGPGDSWIAETVWRLAACHLELKHPDQARLLLADGLKDLLPHGADPLTNAWIVAFDLSLAEVEEAGGRYRDAQLALLAAARRPTPPNADPTIAMAWAGFDLLVGRDAEARAAAANAMRATTPWGGPDHHPDGVALLALVAECERRNHDGGTAERILQRARALAATTIPPDDPRRLVLDVRLADVLMDGGRYDEARPLILGNTTLQDAHGRYRGYAVEYAMAMARLQGHRDAYEAATLYACALPLADTAWPNDARQLQDLVEAAAQAHRAAGHTTQAATLDQRAHAIAALRAAVTATLDDPANDDPMKW
jgi:tetratricopeptide (TPR) repeat protein